MISTDRAFRKKVEMCEDIVESSQNWGTKSRSLSPRVRALSLSLSLFLSLSKHLFQERPFVQINLHVCGFS